MTFKNLKNSFTVSQTNSRLKKNQFETLFKTHAHLQYAMLLILSYLIRESADSGRVGTADERVGGVGGAVGVGSHRHLQSDRAFERSKTQQIIPTKLCLELIF